MLKRKTAQLLIHVYKGIVHISKHLLIHIASSYVQAVKISRTHLQNRNIIRLSKIHCLPILYYVIFPKQLILYLYASSNVSIAQCVIICLLFVHPVLMYIPSKIKWLKCMYQCKFWLQNVSK